MRTGDIVFFKGRSWISKIISRLTGSSYTHVAIAISDRYILEADRFINVRVREIGDSDVYSVRRYKGILTDEDLETFRQIGMYILGNAKYDYYHVFVWFIRLVTRLEFSYAGNSNNVYCTEVIDRMYESRNIDLVSYRATGDILPSHLLNSPLLEEVYNTEGKG